MAMIVPTVETAGDEALTNSLIDRSITELQDNILTECLPYALYGCASLKKLVFGSVVNAQDNAFASLTALESVDLHSKVSLGSQLIYSCKNFKALILRSNEMCTIKTNTFQNSPIASGTGYIYVPAALVDSYKTATNWSTYADQIRAIEEWPEVCDPYSWVAVAIAIEKGTYKDVYAIGDCVPVDLGSEGIIDMQIAAFDADTLADGSGKAAISWVANEVLLTKHRMNPAVVGSSGAYTEGTGAIGGWEKCELRAYLNNTIKPMIPTEAADMIVSVSKKQYAYDTAGKGFDQTTADLLWIPDDSEVGSASKIYGALLTGDNLKKKRGEESWFSTWWHRSADGNNLYRTRQGNATLNYSAAETTGNTICLGFCTGKSK